VQVYTVLDKYLCNWICWVRMIASRPGIIPIIVFEKGTMVNETL
jgi:hypothetical protein